MDLPGVAPLTWPFDSPGLLTLPLNCGSTSSVIMTHVMTHVMNHGKPLTDILSCVILSRTDQTLSIEVD